MNCFINLHRQTSIKNTCLTGIKIRIMEAAIKFARNGERMEFATYLINDGRPIPAALFIDILTEKCQLINKHVRKSRCTLMITANITNASASIHFHDFLFEDSEFRRITLSNHPDLEDQLIHLWTEVRDVLRCYQIDDHDAELSSIDTFYHELEYNEMVAADFMF